jgi:hypothetical protein
MRVKSDKIAVNPPPNNIVKSEMTKIGGRLQKGNSMSKKYTKFVE